jgi:phosphate transport system permease protein
VFLKRTLKYRKLKDRSTAWSMNVSIWAINLFAVILALGLCIKSYPIIKLIPLTELLFGSAWYPNKGLFGFFPYIVGTIEVTLIAMVLSVPICLLSSVYLTEYAKPRIRGLIRPVIDVLAGIPSVIYGLWGVIVIVPLVRKLSIMMGHPSTGYSLLSGGVILAIMVFPIIISVSIDVLQAVPVQVREAALALGATRWETVKHVVLRWAHRGILAAIGLGFTRAFGETMAVLMVVGNVAKIPKSFFDPAYPLPALIANNYGEVMSIPMYDSALMLAALLLLLVVGAFSLVAHATLFRFTKGTQE